MYDTLIPTHTLADMLGDPALVIVDCRFDLADTGYGLRGYLEGHIPGAVYADLDHDLSGPPVTDAGRHPLPTPAALTALFGRLGISRGKQVVAYDDAGGAYASRLWWLLKYMDHEAGALLDGGWQAWLAGGLPTREGRESNSPADFSGAPQRDLLVTAGEVPHSRLLVDSRTPDRYRGENETIDPIAGRIPGAVNYHYGRNLHPDGTFRSPKDLREQLTRLLSGSASEDAVFYCGSGVSACQNLLAQAYAGLPMGKLYAGSWSDWISDRTRPVETG